MSFKEHCCTYSLSLCLKSLQGSSATSVSPVEFSSSHKRSGTEGANLWSECYTNIGPPVVINIGNRKRRGERKRNTTRAP